MLGFKRVVINHLDWWIYSWLIFSQAIIDIAMALLGIFSLGYLTVSWHMNWLWDLETQRLERKRNETYSNSDWRQ